MLDNFHAAMIMMADGSGVKPVETTTKSVYHRGTFGSWNMSQGSDDYPLSKVKIDVQNKVYTNDLWDNLKSVSTFYGWGCPFYSVCFYRSDALLPDIQNYWYNYKAIVEDGTVYSGYTSKEWSSRVYCAVFSSETFWDSIQGKYVNISSYMPETNKPIWITAMYTDPISNNYATFNQPGSSATSGLKTFERKYTPLFMYGPSGTFGSWKYNPFYKSGNNIYWYYIYGYRYETWNYTYKDDGTVQNVDYTNTYYTTTDPTASGAMTGSVSNPWFDGNIVWTSVDKHTLLYHMKRFQISMLNNTTATSYRESIG